LLERPVTMCRCISTSTSRAVNDLDAAPAEETVAAIQAAGGKAVACIGSVTAVDFADRFIG
jgi:3-oxoacyl-[acyl-carrier protein] reductase